MKKIAGYIRVSTTKQVEEGVSIDMQMQLIKQKHVEIAPLEALEFYIDEGLSAKNLFRCNLQALIDNIKLNKVSKIIVYALDRISRSISDMAYFIQLCNDYKVELIAINGEYNDERASDRFGINVRVAVSQFEREIICERTNDGLRAIAESGRYPAGGIVLLGYKRDINKNLVIDSVSSELVKEIFNMAAEGVAFIDIAKYLNSTQSKYKFNSERCYRIAYDKRYIGYYTYKNKEYDNLVPPIIGVELFYKVQQMKTRLKHSRTELYTYNHICRCLKCDVELTCTYGTSHSKERYIYYKCINCGNVSQKLIDRYLLEELGNIVLSNTTSINRLKKIVYYQNKRIKDIESKYIAGDYTEEQYLTLINPLNNDVGINRSAIATLMIADNKKIDLNSLDKEQLKTIYSTSIKYIYINIKAKKVVSIQYL